MARVRNIEVGNPAKVFFPDAGITKGDVVEYYDRVAEHLLPWIRNRPLVMERHPDGIADGGFLQKNAPDHFPGWIRTDDVPIEGGTTRHVVCDDAETLRYLADQGCLAFHVFTSEVDRPGHPDQLVLDLDPSDTSDDPTGDVVRAARLVRRLFDELGIPSFVKSTGSRGLHVHVPLDATAGNDDVSAAARRLAEILVERAPGDLTTSHRRADRGGRLFLDTLRNHYAQHAVAAFSLRALPSAPVAVPLDWDEATASDFDPRRITIANVFRRLGHKADPWADFGDDRVEVRDITARLDEAGLDT